MLRLSLLFAVLWLMTAEHGFMVFAILAIAPPKHLPIHLFLNGFSCSGCLIHPLILLTIRLSWRFHKLLGKFLYSSNQCDKFWIVFPFFWVCTMCNGSISPFTCFRQVLVSSLGKLACKALLESLVCHLPIWIFYLTKLSGFLTVSRHLKAQ